MEQNLQNLQLPVSICKKNTHLLPQTQGWSIGALRTGSVCSFWGWLIRLFCWLADQIVLFLVNWAVCCYGAESTKECNDLSLVARNLTQIQKHGETVSDVHQRPRAAELPEYPLQKAGTDLFHFKNTTYLLVDISRDTWRFRKSQLQLLKGSLKHWKRCSHNSEFPRQWSLTMATSILHMNFQSSQRSTNEQSRQWKGCSRTPRTHTWLWRTVPPLSLGTTSLQLNFSRDHIR